MKTTVKILSIKENKIVCKVAKKRNRLLLPICSSIILAFVLCFSFGGDNLKSVGGSMSYIYDPVNSLYSDNGTIVFTSAYLLEKEKLDFVVPVVGASTEVDVDGSILLTIGNSIMVKASEAGVVEDIGTSLDGIKFIKIRHSIEIYSIVENLDIVGVAIGDTIIKGQDVATAKIGNVVKFQIYQNDMKITNLKIHQSKIIWEK